jgi:uncharacterized membrane protein
MMWWNDSWFMPFPFIGIVFMLLCLGIMLFMMRGMHHRRDYSLDILRERYARGEIGEAEYEQRRRLLQA